MTAASLAVFKRTVTVAWPAHRDAAAQKHLVRVARRGHARILADQTRRAGITPDYKAYANTPGNANLDAVKLPGPIVYRYDYRREIVKVTLAALIAASPRASGDYASNHRVYVNGLPVEGVPATIRQTDVVFISNPMPYARRLEVGKTEAGRNFVLQVPNRIYERVAKNNLMKRYRNVAKIGFLYVGLPGAYKTKAKLGATYRTSIGPTRRPAVTRKRNQKAGSEIRAPAIMIERL